MEMSNRKGMSSIKKNKKIKQSYFELNFIEK